MRKFASLCLVFLLMLNSASINAHHSFAATFTDQIIVVEGIVERVKFTNPHVIIYFQVTDELGEETTWLAEGGSATSLRNSGWDKNTLSKGDMIRVTGPSTRNGSPMVSMQDDGSIELLDPETGAAAGSSLWGEEAERPSISRPLRLANGWPNMTGAWTGESTGREGSPIDNVPPFAYNEIGAAIQAEFDPRMIHKYIVSHRASFVRRALRHIRYVFSSLVIAF